MEALQKILGHPVFGSLLRIAGIILSVVLYRLSRPSNKLWYRVSRQWSRNPRGVVLSAAVWNGGSKAIRSADIGGKTHRLHFRTLNGMSFLEVKRVFTTNGANELTALLNDDDQRVVDITFDYLNPSDGAVLAVMLNGEQIDLDEQTLELTGGIIGMGGPVRATSSAYYLTKLLSALALSWLIFFAGYFSTENLFRWPLMTIGFLLYPFAAGVIYRKSCELQFSQAFVDDFVTEGGYRGEGE